MRDGPFRKLHAAFRTDVSNWGWGLPDDAPSRDVERLMDPEAFRKGYAGKPQSALLPREALFGASLRRALKNVVQRQMTMGFLLEQLPESSNRIRISDDWRDQLGIHRPVINYDISDYTRAGISAAYKLAAAVFRKAGIQNFTDPKSRLGTEIEFKGEKFRYIGAGHIMGTHRMGSNKASSVVNSSQRTWDHDNLYVVGCGSLPTAGTANPTLTATALCIQTAEHLFKTLGLAHR
jgi:choline dehydrogenase-like flavoprotein